MAAKGCSQWVWLCSVRKLSGLPFTADDLVMLTAVCNFAGPASGRSARFVQRTAPDVHVDSPRFRLCALEAKDTYTRGHSERVADYARILGWMLLGMKRHDIDMLVFGAVLHDIGKIGVAEGHSSISPAL